MRRYYVYMLLCSDDSFYVGISNDPDLRTAQHNEGIDEKCYTFRRRPVKLAWCEDFREVLDAIACEKRLKGWSRAKKRALMRGDWAAIHAIVREERKVRESRKVSSRR